MARKNVRRAASKKIGARSKKLSEAEINAARERDMRRRYGGEDPGKKFMEYHKPQKRVRRGPGRKQ